MAVFGLARDLAAIMNVSTADAAAEGVRREKQKERERERERDFVAKLLIHNYSPVAFALLMAAPPSLPVFISMH